MSNPLDALLPKAPEPGAFYRWGYVTSTSPIEVILDNETTPVRPSTLENLSVGERVFVLVENRRATVLGKVPGPAPEPPAPLPAPVSGYLESSTSDNITATSWAQVPSFSIETVGFTNTLDEPIRAQVDVSLWVNMFPSATTSDVRFRVAWSGALTGNSFAVHDWGGVLFVQGPAGGGRSYQSHAFLPVVLDLPPGTTTFSLEAYKTGGTPSSNNAGYCRIQITPLGRPSAWA